MRLGALVRQRPAAVPARAAFTACSASHTLDRSHVIPRSGVISTSDEARAAILARIREARGARAAASATPPADGARGPLPPLETDLAARFCARAESMQASTDRVADLREVPAAVAAYLREHDLPFEGCVSPEIAALDWNAAGLALRAGAARPDDPVGVTTVFAAIAETGTLMLLSGPGTPATASLLPETHIAVAPLARIVPYMEDGWDLLRRERGELPRAVNFVSGPSRTADIDQQIVLGAHGPYRVHIILYG